MPLVDVFEVGTGGGSIAEVDVGGALGVGPRSAGSEPGPASYGRGGERPTVTDANLLLGYLDPRYFLGGRMTLDVEASRAALAALSHLVVEGLLERDGILLANHGAIVVGADMRRALWRAVELEELAKVYYLASLAGAPVVLMQGAIGSWTHWVRNIEPLNYEFVKMSVRNYK